MGKRQQGDTKTIRIIVTEKGVVAMRDAHFRHKILVMLAKFRAAGLMQ